MSEALEARVQSLFPADVRVAVEPIGDDHGLIPPEDAAVSGAIEKRRAEFAAGRRAARVAMGQDRAIPKGSNRQPIWPDGVIGTIAHDQGWAIAATASRGTYAGLGVDLTEAAPLDEKLWKSIFAESDWPASGMEARAGFAAKEALYKALYPAHEAFFGFHAAVVKVDLERWRFIARLTKDLAPYALDEIFEGRLAVEGSVLIAAIAVLD